MKAVIDRYEGEHAVLTPAGGGKPMTLPKGALPGDAGPGDTVELTKAGWVKRGDETEERRKRIAEKKRELFRK